MSHKTYDMINATIHPIKIHIGQLVKDAVIRSPYTQTAVANKLELTKNGFQTKPNTQHYGSIFDINQVSYVLEKDLLSPILSEMLGNGIKLNQGTSIFKEHQKEIKQLKTQINVLTGELEKYQKKK